MNTYHRLHDKNIADQVRGALEQYENRYNSLKTQQPKKNIITNKKEQLNIPKERTQITLLVSPAAEPKNKKPIIALTDSEDSDEELNTPTKTPSTPSNSEKPPIELGITFDEVFQYYWLPELKEWCKRHQLKTSGTQREVIQRILKHLEAPDDETLLSTYHAPKKRRKTVAPVQFGRHVKKPKVQKKEDVCSDSDEEKPKKKNVKKEVVPLEQRIAAYTVQLERLAEMGFTDPLTNVTLLEKCNGNVDRVLNILLHDTPLTVKTRRKS
jgi:hypothetical protein